MNERLVMVAAETVQSLLSGTDENSQERGAKCSSSVFSLESSIGRVNFITYCPDSGFQWTQIVDLLDWESTIPPDVRAENPTFDRIRAEFFEVLRGPVQVHCYCHAFRWWSHWYNLKEMDTSIEKNIVAPNPDAPGYKFRQQTFSCKHLVSVFQKFFV